MRHLLPLLLPALLALTPARAQAEEDVQELIPARMTLAVNVKTARPAYGAPFALDVTLTNRSRHALPVHCSMSASSNPSIQLELIDKEGVVWLPATTPKRPTFTSLGDNPYAIAVGSAQGFRDNVWTLAPGKRLRFALELSWFRRKVSTDGAPTAQPDVPGLPAGAYTVRAVYAQKGASVPSAKPFWNPRLIQIEPTRPMKVVPGLYQGTLKAETAVEVHAPTTSRTDALNHRVRELERQLAEAHALLAKVRKLVDGSIRHMR